MVPISRRRPHVPMLLATVPLLWVGASAAPSVDPPPPAAVGSVSCAYQSDAWWHDQREAAIARGEIDDPATRLLPRVEPRRVRTANAHGLPCLTPQQIFLFEDTERVLLSDYSFGELENLMTEAANALLARHGDNFDFVGFWLSFQPSQSIGSAFYRPIENDVLGIGDPGGAGIPLFDIRPSLGLAGEHVEGFLMMWNVALWTPGDGASTYLTRLTLAHELEHRFAMHLPELSGGVPLQGDDASCGRDHHWSWRVDGQGSAMEIQEWEGTNPAVRTGSPAFGVRFNTDTGGAFSHVDLYLMGYESPEEMDAGISEFRYMLDTSCNADYFGPIRHLTSADVIAAAGPRVPNSANAPKHYRMGWVMIHLPGDPPTAEELDRAVGVMQQQQIDWSEGTLGRGTLDDTLFSDCNCNGAADSGDVVFGGSQDTNGNQIPDECEDCVLEDCDEDGVLNPEDNCPFVANPDQGPAVFPEPLEAAERAAFCWIEPMDVVWVRGALRDVDVYEYDRAPAEVGSTCINDSEDPAMGEGFYYLARPNCAAGSWQTVVGTEPDRDLSLP